MSWKTLVSLDQDTAIAATEVAFELNTVQHKFTLDSGESAVIFVKATSGGSTDDCRFSVYSALQDSPSDWTTTLAGSQWSRIREVVHDTSSPEDNIWIPITISWLDGRCFVITAVRNAGSTDSFTIDAQYRIDGIVAP